MLNKEQKQTREAIAMEEIGKTTISKGNQQLLFVFFIVLLISGMLAQFFFAEKNETQLTLKTTKEKTKASSLFETLSQTNTAVRNHIEALETGIEENSVLRKTFIPVMQSVLFNVFQTGNENAWISDENFYYKHANQYLTQAGFLEPIQLKKRAVEGIQPNPIKAILDFKKQLAKRNIQLMIVPAPPKASFVLKKGEKAVNNQSYTTFINTLRQHDILVCDVFQLFEKKRLSKESYLKYDTHWTPKAMEMVAQEMARVLDSSSIPKGTTQYTTKNITVENYGDIADMLHIDKKDLQLQPQKVAITQVLDENFLFKPSSQSDILFLGDSYANIFSSEIMNWGSAAGLSEQLSNHMQKPVDRIQMNDAGAHATRVALSNELKRGKDRLAGKKIVIWEFAARELSFGDWKLINIELNENYISNFFVPKEQQSVTVTGIVSETSQVPIPSSVPYKDHLVSAHITALKNIETGEALGESVVYLASMKDNVWTDAARLRNGQKVTLTLYNWNDFSETYGAVNRSELQDDELSFEDPCWGILLDNRD
ncbi:acetyltransferase AlgX (SGNH hydrolase-like protein) [Kordia periserrulae]|uniref:Acetyltransferase AlgX (SGNH hydrolase-like protein) n=1 Tax=Kordia periserrulae TaxID=701523 RepID=A0A2T6C3Q2_9FLAO|nr:hypothetical protein [Kordia periserrulae]PTX62934.1 acetyltransferase AlgX (SGNH hydrolase-like protein) [Kordia periserrulae]